MPEKKKKPVTVKKTTKNSQVREVEIKSKSNENKPKIDAEETPADEVEETTSSKNQKPKKVIYLEIDDEATTVYDKIKSIKHENIFLVIPKRALLFQSVVNLKIIKRKAEELCKEISIITNDPNGTHLAKMIGLPVYDSVSSNLANQIQNDGKLVTESSSEPDIAPLKASGNIMRDEKPRRLSERKLSIAEMLNNERKKTGMVFSRIRKRKKVTSSDSPEEMKKGPRLVFVAPNKQALVLLTIASLLIFLAIAYIALPGATIYITPKSNVLTTSINVTLADFTKNAAEFESHPAYMLASYPVSDTYTKTLQHNATGKIFKGVNARGKIKIINESNRNWPLVAQTRFQSPDGIIFRIAQQVSVPPKRGDQNGSLLVDVVADEYDAYGEITGARGNLPPTKFSIPGLRNENQQSLYGISEEAMTGGNTEFIKIISENDVEAAKQILSEALKEEAVSALREKVYEQSRQNNSSASFELLVDNTNKSFKGVDFSEIRIDADESLVGKEAESFNLTAAIDVSGVYFSKDELVELLRNELVLKKSPEKQITKIEDNSIVFTLFDEDARAGKLRVTASIRGIEEFSINPNDESGQRLIKIIRDHVVGKKIDEAQSYVQNLPEVNRVDIQSWPGWAPTMPSVADNIKIEVKK